MKPIFDGNEYPRLASSFALTGEGPRGTCIHDPAGQLASCDMCPDRLILDGVGGLANG